MLRLTIEHAQLAPALRRVAATADPRSTIAAYGAVKLTTDQDGLLLTAANTVALLSERIGLPGCQPGHVYLAAARLRDLVGSLDPDKPIEIRDDESGVRLQSGRTRARLERISSTGFPAALPVYPEAMIETTTDEFYRVLSFIFSAVGTDKDRALYGSACMFANGVGVWLTAIDGVQGAIAYFDGAAALNKFPDALIPRSTIARLLGLTKVTADAPLYITVNKSLAQFTAGEWTLASRLANVDFPDPEIWVAPAVEWPIVLDAKSLERILGRLDAATDLDHVKLRQRGAELRAMNGSLTVIGNRDVIVDDMPVTMGIEPIRIGVNSRQLRHCLHAIGAERVELHIGDRAIRVCAVGEERESYTLAPYRV